MSQLIIAALDALIHTGKAADLEVKLNDNITECLRIRNLSFDDIIESELLSELDFITSKEDSAQWKFVTTISHTLLSLVKTIETESDYMMSVNCRKNIKSSLQFVVSMGILPNLIPGVGVTIEKRSELAKYYNKENTPILEKYIRLKLMCNLLVELCRNSDIKSIIYTNIFGDYLALLMQLCFAPVVKPMPSNNNKKSLEFIMSEELYNQIQADQKHYKTIFDSIVSKTYKPLLMKELIILQGVKDPEPPTFMKRALGKEMSHILLSDDGLLCVMRCFFDDENIDIGNQWEQIEMIKKLVSIKHGSITIEGYLKNIGDQIKNIILTCENKDYVIVAAACIETLSGKYSNNEHILDAIGCITKPFLFDEQSDFSPLVLSSEEVSKYVNIIDLCFNTPKLCLSPHLLTPVIHSLFSIRAFSTADVLKMKLNNILSKYFSSKCYCINKLFNSLIFGESNKNIIVNKNISYETTTNGVQINYFTNSSNVTTGVSFNCTMEIIENNPDKNELAVSFFVYCLSKLLTLSANAKSNVSRELLMHEDETCDLIGKESESLLILLKVLEKLSSMKSITTSIRKNPNLIMNFIVQSLNDCVGSLASNKKSIFDTACMHLCLSLISLLLTDAEDFDVLKMTLKPIEPLIRTILEKSTDGDMKYLCKEIDKTLKQGKRTEAESEFEKALNEVCDPLLPVRAHGLLHLTKLIEEKDDEALSKKYYVQCIFEQNLKDEDSYVYLTAINGLAAMVNLSAEEILAVLTREFVNYKNEACDTEKDKEERLKVRMKIGEVLVKVTKALGEMAPAHKALLLNTFLVGCKDTDDLLRASSLSNLAEVCKVLSYKLGSVLYELLNCIDSILLTDKSQECRRASVMVVSSLLKGLGGEALYYLRETLLPIYRTLKKLYKNDDEDHTVRLHAQIGLEELDNIVRGTLFAPINMEKKIFIP